MFLSRATETTFAFDKPIHTGIATLACAGGATVAFSKWIQRREDVRSHKGGDYESVPLNDVGEPHASRQPSPARSHVEHTGSLRKLRLYFILLVAALCLRVELLREVIRNVQCCGLSWAPLVPIAVAVWDYWTVQRKRRRDEFDDEGASVYETLEQSFVATPISHLAVVALCGVGGMLALASSSNPPSTFICAAIYPYRWLIPVLQRLGSLLDFLIVFCTAKLLTLQDGRGSRQKGSKLASVGYAFLVSMPTHL